MSRRCNISGLLLRYNTTRKTTNPSSHSGSAVRSLTTTISVHNKRTLQHASLLCSTATSTSTSWTSCERTLCAFPMMNISSSSSSAVRMYSSSSSSSAAATEVRIAVPPIAESVSSGKLKGWCVAVGDYVLEDAELCQIESDKLEIPVRAPRSGTIRSILAQEGDMVNVGQEIVLMECGGSVASSPAAAPPKKEAAAAPPSPAAPAPRAAAVSSSAAASSAAAAPTSIVFVASGADSRIRRVRTSSMRLRIADRLKASQNTTAMLTTFNEIDMLKLIQLRDRYKDEFLKKHGVKLGFMSAFAKAAATALMEVPIINASWEEEHIVYHDYADISVAVATPNGLVVPVLRDVQDMSFRDIECKIAEFGKKAKDRTLTLAEMTGGTFTISNGGVFGSWFGTPIINPPQSAILGMHAVKQKPWVAEDGKSVVVRPIMAVALTYDHRLIDGRDAVTFLVKIKQCIEDPERLVLGL